MGDSLCRSKRAAFLGAVAMIAFFALGCSGLVTQPVFDRPEAERDHMGIVVHQGGEAVDVAIVASSEATATEPRAWVATPFSVRRIGLSSELTIGGMLDMQEIAGTLQLVEFMTSRPDGRVNTAIAADGSTGYAVVVNDRGLEVLVDSSEVGRLDCLVSGDDVAFLNGMVYVADGDAGMQVIDATDPLAPVLTGGANPHPGMPAVAVATPDYCNEAPGVAEIPADTRVLLAQGSSVLLYDCADPSSPELLSSVLVSGVRKLATQVRAGTLYVYAITDTDMHVFYVDEQNALTQYGGVGLADDLNDISVYGDHAWVSANDRTVSVDISDPEVPVLLDEFASDASASGVAAIYERCAVAEGSAGTQLYTASNASEPTTDSPGSPMPVDVTDVYCVPMSDGWGVAQVYVAERGRGIFTYSLIGPATPAGLEVPVPGGGTIEFPLIVAEAPAGLVLTHVAEDPNAEHFGTTTSNGYPLPLFVSGGGTTVNFYGGLGYGEMETNSVFGGSVPDDIEALDLVLGGAMFMVPVADGDAGLVVLGPKVVAEETATIAPFGTFDMIDPATGVLAVGGFESGVTTDSVVLVGSSAGNLYSVDASECLTAELASQIASGGPTVDLPQLDSIALGGAIGGMEPRGQQVFVACGEAGVRVVDVSDPGVLAIVGTVPVPGAIDVRLFDDTLYVTVGTGIEAWDVSDLGDPQRLSAYGSIEAARLDVVAGLPMPVVASGDKGVTIFSDPRLVDATAEVENVEDGAAYLTPAYPWAQSRIDTATLVGAAVPYSLWENDYVSHEGPDTLEKIVRPRTPRSWEATMPGVYTTSAYAADVGGNAAADSAEFRIITDERIAGRDRYATAVASSREMYPDGTDTIVLATGRTFQDALVAAPLGYALEAPVLLTKSTVPSSTAEEIERLDTEQVVIVGGTKAVPDSVIDELVALGIERTDISRVAGATAVETAEEVALQLGYALGHRPRTAYVVNRWATADTTLIAGHAARDGAPILLVERDEVPSATQRIFTRFGTDTTVLTGGPACISPELVFPGDVTWLYGDTRYETSKVVAEWALGRGLAPTYVYLATGLDWVDCVSAGQLCARDDAPVLLTNTGLPAATEAFLSGNKRSIVHLRIMGGTSAVPSAVETSALEAIGLAVAPGPIPVPPVEEYEDPMLAWLEGSLQAFIGFMSADGGAEEAALVQDGPPHADSATSGLDAWRQQGMPRHPSEPIPLETLGILP